MTGTRVVFWSPLAPLVTYMAT